MFALMNVYVGKPSGYDRVRNAEIGNKVRVNGGDLVASFFVCLFFRILNWRYLKRLILPSTGLYEFTKSRILRTEEFSLFHY